MPRADIIQRTLGEAFAVRSANAVRAMMPPSPLLSARVMNTTYFSDTVIVKAQNTSERIPKTFSGVTARGW
jgi:hypothetical protein